MCTEVSGARMGMWDHMIVWECRDVLWQAGCVWCLMVGWVCRGIDGRMCVGDV